MELLAGNLREAYALGMIACSRSGIDDFIVSAAATWNAATEQDTEYGRVMQRMKTQFHTGFRPIQAFRGRNIPFCSVMSLGDFSAFWLDELNPAPGDGAEPAKNQIAAISMQTAPATADDTAKLQDGFVRLNAWIKRSGSVRGRSGIMIGIGALLDPSARPFWVGGRVNRPAQSAQYWRDRLGLVHVRVGSRCCKELLVRMRFVAGMAADDLPRKRHLEHRAGNPNLLWMFRPSVVHGGNRRFVQGVAADRTTRPARRGSTRDISTIDYLEGERELLLLAGEIADARLVGLDLLDGFADTDAALDSNDDAFVQAIARQRGWT